MSQIDAGRQAFFEEAHELLGELESSLLTLEAQPEDQELIDRVFRSLHTIKGSGAMFGFDTISSFTHQVESVFDLVRNHQLPVTKPLLDLTLASRDHLFHLLEAAVSGSLPDTDRSRAIIEGLHALSSKESSEAEESVSPASAPSTPPSATASTPSGSAIYRIRFKPEHDIFKLGANPLALLDEVRHLGTAKVFVHLDDLPLLDALDPDKSHLWWDIVLDAPVDEEAIEEVFLFVEDSCELRVQVVDREGTLDANADYKMVGQILQERGDLTAEDLGSVLQERKKLGEVLAERGVVSKEMVESALAEQQAVRQLRETRTKAVATQPSEVASSIRVAAEKLDTLVDLVGELVIVQAQISQVVGEHRDSHLITLAEMLERLSNELRDSTLGIRMLPIGSTFSKFRRLVRDLSLELHKEIELTTEGEETELDKTVIERLNDPLVHLLRNSIDHGIESPDERTTQGKPRAGRIHLSAEHSGGDVLIRIHDDGAGIDLDAVRGKAVERGLISAEADLPKKDVLALIFAPGFSTAKQVTNISGRGVGMDVVKRSIDGLRGSVEIDSARGEGTTITIKLPLTLAIIEGLQVQVGEEFFVIPLTMVEECVELVHRAGQEGREQIVNLRGDIVPYLCLGDWFAVPGDRPSIEQIVVVGVHGTRFGIVVDRVVGEHQTVIKSLGKVYRDVEGISGATIRGDGTLALILDVPRLVQTAVSFYRTMD